MKRKYILTPVLLLIYLAAIAWVTHPSKNPDQSHAQYYITITVTVVIIIVLFFFLKKKDRNEQKYKEKKDD